MKVRNYTFDAQSNPTTMFCSDYSRDKFDLDPPYQRGPVWGEERKRNLIRSLYMGLPVGAMFVNRRRYPETWTVIDGKQRILAVRDFVDEEFTIPGSWFGPEHELHPDNNYYYSELGRLAQRVFETGTQIAVYYTDFHGNDVLEREAELFELINFGGVPQGESDLATQPTKETYTREQLAPLLKAARGCLPEGDDLRVMGYREIPGVRLRALADALQAIDKGKGGEDG